MHSQLSSESLQGGRSSQVGWQRVADSRSNVTKRTSAEGFQVCFGNSLQSFCQRTKGARWLICAERRRQVWWKSAAEVMESECCELVQSSCVGSSIHRAVGHMLWDRCGCLLCKPVHPQPPTTPLSGAWSTSEVFFTFNHKYGLFPHTQEERLGGGEKGVGRVGVFNIGERGWYLIFSQLCQSYSQFLHIIFSVLSSAQCYLEMNKHSMTRNTHWGEKEVTKSDVNRWVTRSQHKQSLNIYTISSVYHFF